MRAKRTLMGQAWVDDMLRLAEEYRDQCMSSTTVVCEQCDKPVNECNARMYMEQLVSRAYNNGVDPMANEVKP